MLSEILVNDLTWIDEAFSKDYVDELEAACCLTDGQNRVYFGDKVSGYFVEHEVHPNLRKNYRVIASWNFPRRCLFDFINKAIEKNLQSFRKEFLLKKCNESFLTMSPDYQKRFILDYYYISLALDLMVINEDTSGNSEHLPDDEYPWVAPARKIYYELELEKSHLNLLQRAKKVEKEMNKRLSKGEKEMGMRGGRKEPSASSIMRHALINL